MLKNVIFFSIFVSILRVLYVLSGHIDLSPEEAQYWLWSKHLDWSYYSKPPLIAYMNAISTAILGDAELGVRINAIILGGLIAVITYFLAKEIFKGYFTDNENLERFAFFCSVLIYGTVGYNLASILFLTDTPLLFFFSLTVLFFWKSVRENKPYLWILTGIFAGLGFLAKYSMILIIPPIIIYGAFFNRKLFFNRWFYISVFIASLFTLPVLIWNYQHDWVSFKHVSSLEGSHIKEITLKKSIQYIGDYIAGQILIISLFLFPFIVYTVFQSIKNRKKEEVFYLFIIPSFIFFVFLYIALKKKVEANWPAFAYISFFILMGFFIYNSKKIVKYFYIPFALSIISLIFLFYTPLLDKVGLGELLPPKKDPTKRLVGWRDLGNEVSKIVKSLGNDRYFLFSETYQVASEMAFYVKPFSKVFCINIGRRKNQFDLWEDINNYSNKGYYGIYITKFSSLPAKVKSAFGELLLKRELKIIYRGEVVKTYYIYLLKDFKGIENLKVDRY